MHRTSTLLNRQLAAVVTGLRFGETIVVADAGLPVPQGVPTLDLALCAGIPSVEDVVRVLAADLVIEEVLIAAETAKVNEMVRDRIHSLFAGTDKVRDVPHDHIEAVINTTKLVVQTGEVTPYGNVVIVGGLDFFALDMAN